MSRRITASLRRRRGVYGVLAAILGVLWLGAALGPSPATSTPAFAQDRYLYWERFDVTIDRMETATNRFRVTEDYRLVVERGPFRYGFREIPTERMEALEGLQVFHNGQPLTPNCSQYPGTYCVTQTSNAVSLRYYFSAPLESNTTANIRLVYTVRGALRAYEEGDELFWVALPPDLSFPVHWSRVTVHLPEGVQPLAATSYPNTWRQQINGNVITWDSPEWPSRQGQAEVRVKYPHDPQMPQPSWQAAYDREQAYIEKWQPLVSLLVLALSALVAIGGVLGLIVLYQRRGRDPDPLSVPEYITRPPNNEAPGIVGALVDERVDMKDIMATLVDLARRGYVVFEQTSEGALGGLLGGADFVFHRTSKALTLSPKRPTRFSLRHQQEQLLRRLQRTKAGQGGQTAVDSPSAPPEAPEPPSTEETEEEDHLRHFEVLLLRALFGGRRKVALKDLRNKFYKHIPRIRNAMYAETVRRGYFITSPQSVRTRWTVFSVIGLSLGGVGVAFSLGMPTLLLISPLLPLLPAAVALVSLVSLVVGQFMPAKTMRGAQQAAMWLAFKRYLENLKRYDTDVARERFEAYLPYAIAFGLEERFIKQVAPMLERMPTWYYPTYMGGPWHGGYRPGYHPMSGSMGRLGGGLGSDGGFSMGGGLEGMSRSLTDGLNAMSQGLTDLLNSASRAMTSSPSSSGGGGFSGGGAGGGSGGGSAGFG